MSVGFLFWFSVDCPQLHKCYLIYPTDDSLEDYTKLAYCRHTKIAHHFPHPLHLLFLLHAKTTPLNSSIPTSFGHSPSGNIFKIHLMDSLVLFIGVNPLKYHIFHLYILVFHTEPTGLFFSRSGPQQAEDAPWSPWF